MKISLEDEAITTLRRIEDFVVYGEKSRKQVHKSQRNTLQKARVILSQMSTKEKKIIAKIEKKLDEHESTLREMLKVMENVDETLCNVLFAIRQNEYLQAYYPAQNGQQAQRVVGKYTSTKSLKDIPENVYTTKDGMACKKKTPIVQK